MANVDRPRGLKPVRYIDGRPYNGAVKMYYKSGAGALYVGSAVQLVGNGSPDGKAPGCKLASGTGTIIGAVVGIGGTNKAIAADPTNLSKVYLPASTAGYVAVAEGADLLFEMQEDNAGSAYLTTSDIGRMFPIVSNSTGSTTTGYSSAEIDSDGEIATSAAVTTAAVQLVAAVDSEDNQVGSSAAHAKWLVRVVNHQYTENVDI